VRLGAVAKTRKYRDFRSRCWQHRAIGWHRDQDLACAARATAALCGRPLWPYDRKGEAIVVQPSFPNEPQQAIPRYFFNIRRLEREDRDGRGAALLDETAALDYALSGTKV
jgi:hypothetical protein